MYKKILVAVDGSATSNKALVAALQLAREIQARVRITHLVDEIAFLSGVEYTGELMRLAKDRGVRVLELALDIAKSSGVEADTALLEDPGQRLGDAVAAEAARWGADLIVTGTHGRRGIGRVMLGSGADQVIRSSPVPVLVIRGDPGDE
ncbi:MAG: universal stress protein [Burkholderiales bacterium]|nr:universal stress protein [Burkholderiales bacterium]